MRMRELDVGALPICHNDRIVGILTDRDLVTKALATGLAESPGGCVAQDIMTSPVVYAYEDEDVDSAVRLMEVKQIRRLIILSRVKRLVGILSLGDVAARSNNASLSAEVLHKICEKSA